MSALVLVFILILLLAVVLLQDFPWLGIPQTWGRDPGLVTKGVVLAFALLTVAVSVGRIVQELF
jgi:hypothetical protein